MTTAVHTEAPKPTPPTQKATVISSRVAPNQPLTSFDRCDCSAVEGDKNGHPRRGTCGAQALVRVTLITGGQLLFCGHHYTQWGPKLTDVSQIRNEREQDEVAPVTATTTAQRTPLVSAK
ncbi:MAG: DUF7455 domain-containing protein [Propionicimonas sp.]